jgi:hypothetical protein
VGKIAVGENNPLPETALSFEGVKVWLTPVVRLEPIGGGYSSKCDANS